MIGSTADTILNRLDTGTVEFSDIQNSAEYDVEHQSMGISPGGNIGGQFVGNMVNSLRAGVNGSGSGNGSSTTKSAMSEGTITHRDRGITNQAYQAFTDNRCGTGGKVLCTLYFQHYRQQRSGRCR